LRRYPERPIVGVGAVIVDGDRVVLVKRAHEPLKGEWSLPGGTVEVGETLAEAVAREVHEETGLNVHVGPLVEVLDRIHRDREQRVEYHFVLLDYRCTVASGTLTHGSDASAVCWASTDELARYGLSESALRVVAKALELGH
jgi:8-oxo-dGTP diphosphatase